MTILETLIEFNNLEKQNRKNRLEDKLKQQEYYGEIKELFDPLTKTLNANNEAIRAQNEQNLALGEQTLRAIEWRNKELDKQTKAISEAGETGETGELIINEPKPFLVDKDTAYTLRLMLNQSNPQLKLEFKDVENGEYTMNNVNITLDHHAFIVRDNIFEFSDGFINFLTNPNITYANIEYDEKK